jgi:vacuolar-type H+-ATPase subunit H
MGVELIKQIKESEKKAREIVEGARQEAQGIADASEKDVETLLAEAREKIKDLKAKAILDGKQKAGREVETLRSEMKGKTADLREKAERNLDRAAALLVEKVFG